MGGNRSGPPRGALGRNRELTAMVSSGISLYRVAMPILIAGIALNVLALPVQEFVLPHLAGSPISELDIWHGSNRAEPSYVELIPEAYLQLWTEAEREWASGLYHSRGFQSARERYIEISRLLDTTPPGAERNRLVEEMDELEAAVESPPPSTCRLHAGSRLSIYQLQWLNEVSPRSNA